MNIRAPRKRKQNKSTDDNVLLYSSKAAKRIYGRYPNVLGVGAGIKFSNRLPITQQLAVHFYVRKKVRRMSPAKQLPRFVYARKRNGAVNYTHKIPTDVIELSNLKFACKSGTEIGVIGETGALNLLFRNKTGSRKEFYVITCAHVAGDVRQSPPVDPEIESSCCDRRRSFATTIVNSTQKNGIVDYDIALGRIATDCLPQSELQVNGASVTLRRFLPATDIRPGLTLDCAFPRSNIVAAVVSSFRTSLPLNLDDHIYTVNNLFLINQPPRPGDSGGLLYTHVEAAGILVGLSDSGWGLFQPLEEAFEFLNTISPITVRCF